MRFLQLIILCSLLQDNDVIQSEFYQRWILYLYTSFSNNSQFIFTCDFKANFNEYHKDQYILTSKNNNHDEHNYKLCVKQICLTLLELMWTTDIFLTLNVAEIIDKLISLIDLRSEHWCENLQTLCLKHCHFILKKSWLLLLTWFLLMSFLSLITLRSKHWHKKLSNTVSKEASSFKTQMFLTTLININSTCKLYFFDWSEIWTLMHEFTDTVSEA